MSGNRIEEHPILTIADSEKINFFWNGKKLTAKKNEVISSALFANGIKIFGQVFFKIVCYSLIFIILQNGYNQKN